MKQHKKELADEKRHEDEKRQGEYTEFKDKLASMPMKARGTIVGHGDMSLDNFSEDIHADDDDLGSDEELEDHTSEKGDDDEGAADEAAAVME